MSYNTVEEFRALAFPYGAYDDFDDSTVQNQLDIAKSTIDAALRNHHVLPLQENGYDEIGIIRDAEIVIASYRLMLQRGLKAAAGGGADQHLRERYGEIMHPDEGLLNRISNGRLLLSRKADKTRKRERRPRMSGSPGISFRRTDCRGRELI